MIRLQRFGRKNDPSFRVVLTDKRNAPKSGKFLEILGFMNPKTKQKKLVGERINYWINKGAKVSPTVHNMLVGEKMIEGKKINVVPLPKTAEKNADSNADNTPNTDQRQIGVDISDKSADVDNNEK